MRGIMCFGVYDKYVASVRNDIVFNRMFGDNSYGS